MNIFSHYRRTRNWYIISRHSNHFLSSQWAGGVMLVIFAIVAMVLANLESTKHIYHHILTTDIGFNIGSAEHPLWSFSLNIEQWINDALMVVFFFVVGLEIKREIIAGQLSDIRQASLPIAAAIGGMVVPALIYALLNNGTDYSAGWGIPMATDIAFAIGVLSLLGNRVPLSLKIFLTALAIVDDLGAILVIAIFYTSQINLTALVIGLLILVLLAVFNRMGIKRTSFYVVPGIVLWYLFLKSGIHATIAGVLLAMVIPTVPRFNKRYFSYKIKYFLEEFKHSDRKGVEVLSNETQLHALDNVKKIAGGTASISQSMEHSLHSTVAFLIMPIFALANAGVEIHNVSDLQIFHNTQGMGIFLGLVVGKPLGILALCWLAIKLKLGVLPTGSNWSSLFAVSCLGGIGFTMSIFITNLAFKGSNFVGTGKIAVLLASIAAALLGALIINLLGRKKGVVADKRS